VSDFNAESKFREKASATEIIALFLYGQLGVFLYFNGFFKIQNQIISRAVRKAFARGIVTEEQTLIAVIKVGVIRAREFVDLSESFRE